MDSGFRDSHIPRGGHGGVTTINQLDFDNAIIPASEKRQSAEEMVDEIHSALAAKGQREGTFISNVPGVTP